MEDLIFLKIEIQCKSEIDNDWRSFLHFLDVKENMVHEIRGYGNSPAEAATSAMSYYKVAPFYHSEDCWENKKSNK